MYLYVNQPSKQIILGYSFARKSLRHYVVHSSINMFLTKSQWQSYIAPYAMTFIYTAGIHSVVIRSVYPRSKLTVMCRGIEIGQSHGQNVVLSSIGYILNKHYVSYIIFD